MKFGVFLSVTLLTAAAIGAIGCSSDLSMGAGDESSDNSAYDSIAKQFGNDMKDGNWSDAYSLTTAAYKATTTQAQMQKQYDDMVAEIKKDDSTYAPNMVDVGHGELPDDEKDAEETYEFKNVPPKSTWKAWLFAEVGVGDKDAMERSISADLFVVDENGQNKIQYVEFEYGD